MALPPGINGKTLVFGRDSFFNGVAVTGRVVVSTRKNVKHITSGRKLIAGDMVCLLQDGTATFPELVPNDTPGLDRYDWTYHVRFELNGANDTPEAFDFLLFNDDPATIDGDALAPVPSSIGTPISVNALRIPPGGVAGQALVFNTDFAVSWGDFQPVGDYATNDALSTGLGTKVNSSTYTAGLALKQDAATLDAATAAVVTPGGSATAAALAADPALRAAYVSQRPGLVDVRDFGAKGNGTADDAPAITAAQDSLGAAGGVVYFPPGRYRLATTVPLADKVTYRGASPVASVITSTTAIEFLFKNSKPTDVGSVIFEQLGFAGNAVLPALFPTRARSQTGSAARTAIAINGKANDPAQPAFSGLTIRHCRFVDFIAPPFSALGVSGRANVHNNLFTNCMDPGFTHTDEVLFNDNICEKSADNGVSISRITSRAVVTGNLAVDCAFHGIFVSGWTGVDNVGNTVSEVGPSKFTVVGNTVQNSGWYGIGLVEAPSHGVVVGNLVDGVTRGPLDMPSDSYGIGIFITGWPMTNVSNPTTRAHNLLITDNIVRRADRFGIAFRGTDVIKVSDNLLEDIGTQFKADGTTVIGSTDTGQNIGIFAAVANGTYSSMINDNFVIDHRATKYTNYGVYVDLASGQPLNMTRRGNKELGIRNPSTENVLTYSRAGESAAEAQLRATLAAAGLVIDNTTA